jgi:hypothetical protein
MHLNLSLPERIAAGAVRDADGGLEVIRKAGGGTVRNLIWDAPVRSWEVPFPPVKLTNPDLIAVQELWRATEYGAHTFNYFDDLDGENVRVRIDGKLTISHIEGPYYQVETLVLVEEPE